MSSVFTRVALFQLVYGAIDLEGFRFLRELLEELSQAPSSDKILLEGKLSKLEVSDEDVRLISELVCQVLGHDTTPLAALRAIEQKWPFAKNYAA